MFFIHTFSMIKVFKKREEVEQLWKIQELKKSALIIIGADLMHLVTSTARFISSGNSI